MVYIGIDDTDVPGGPGTNQLARAIVARLQSRFTPRLILRHQLLSDPRVPCTTKNGSASILLESNGDLEPGPLAAEVKGEMLARFQEGSDPGLCVTECVPEPIRGFGRRCQGELVRQADARALAVEHGIHLEGLGGTQDGVIGALAAVGLAATGSGGRVVHIGSFPDDLSGLTDVEVARSRGIDIRSLVDDEIVTTGVVDVGKHLRPNYRNGRIVIYVARLEGASRSGTDWQAVRLA